MAQEEPTNYQFAGTGLGLSYIGKDHCYAYSGVITYTNTGVNALSFTSGSGSILATVGVNTLDYDGDDLGVTVVLNSITVIRQRYVTLGGTEFTQNFPWTILIPPFTLVEISLENLTNSDPHTANVTLTGRVYGAE